MSESDKIISYQDWLFIKEVSLYWQQICELDNLPTHKARECLTNDTDRCIKILEDCKDVRI